MAGFGSQLAMMSMAPIITDLASKLLGGVLGGQRGSGRGGGKRGGGGVDFTLPGNSSIVGLPNHFPPYTHYRPNDRARKVDSIDPLVDDRDGYECLRLKKENLRKVDSWELSQP